MTTVAQFDLGYHPEDAEAAARACRAAADECRSASRFATGASNSALDGWTGTARDQFVAVAQDHLAEVAALASALDEHANDIEAAARAAARVRQELVAHEAEVRRMQERAEAAAREAAEERAADAADLRRLAEQARRGGAG